jgi:hypothetical protein
MIKGLLSDISETDEEQRKQPISLENVSITDKIVDIITQIPSITVKELAKILSYTDKLIFSKQKIRLSVQVQEKQGIGKSIKKRLYD